VDLAKINQLRRSIFASIGECVDALEQAGGDFGKALDILKKAETGPIVWKTGASIEQAYEFYQAANGDIDKAVEKLAYMKDSHDWEAKNAPKVEEYIAKINRADSVYDLFELCPMDFRFDSLKIFEALYDFYSAMAPGELDNIALTEDESRFAEIKKALTIIGCTGLSDLFRQYLKAYRDSDRNKMNGLDSKFWELDEEFGQKLRGFVIENVEAIFSEKYRQI
jgi:Translation elongation factor Ts